jgi:hypothetical protein
MNKTLPLGIFQKNKNKRNFIDNSLIFYLIGSEMLKRRKTFSFSFSRLIFFSRDLFLTNNILYYLCRQASIRVGEKTGK